MIPRTVEYTGLSLDPMTLLESRILQGPIPPHWVRLRFEVDNFSDINLVDRWLFKNINDRWAHYLVSRTDKFIVTLAFENDNDAVYFQLSDGKKAWKEIKED